MDNTACILAIDQGTTSSRAMVFDEDSQVVAQAQREFAQHYPQPGWVEHDPEEIWQTTLTVSRQAFSVAEQQGYRIVAIGITNQRETTLVWDKESGRTLYNAIVWQDRRTAEFCAGLEERIPLTELQAKTGLLPDPYFSASKIGWILDHVEDARQQAEQGRLAFGTIDSFLVWRLTGGKAHATDATNASRTSLYNIARDNWDKELLAIFNIPESLLPAVKDCAADYGMTAADLFGRAIPILGIAGDQQAAAIGQCCFAKGDIKSTYGTGCFVLMNTGQEQVQSSNRLLSTIAYRLDGQVTYGLEGSIFTAGAGVQWLRDGLGVITGAAETEQLATSLENNGGVYLVPAFTGLGAPHWDPGARGAIHGLTRGSGVAHLVRAMLESVCYQTADLFTAMAEDGVTARLLKVDGGMAVNNWLVQFLSDVLTLPVQRPGMMETTALGAAYLAGMQAGVYGGFADIAARWQLDREFQPAMAEPVRDTLMAGWASALQKTLTG